MWRRAPLLLLAAGTALACQAAANPPADAPADRGALPPRSNDLSWHDKAQADAAADLAKGVPVIMMSSGIARYPLTPDRDAATGLPFRDTGCVIQGDYNDTYNAAIHAWIAQHELPATSIKARFLDGGAIDEALRRGADLAPGGESRAPDGTVATLQTNGTLHLEGGAFAAPFVRSLMLGPDAKARLAWGPNKQVLVLIEGPKHEGSSGRVRLQIDPGCGCLLQVLG